MTSQFYHNKNAITLNDVILDELHTAIRNFLSASLNIFSLLKDNGQNYKCHLFNLNLNDVDEFHAITEFENGFSKMFCQGIELFELLLSVNIVDQNYYSHIKLVVLLDHLRRLIYEGNNPACQSSVSLEKVMKLPGMLPLSFSSDIKGAYDALDQYGKFPGIINLLKKFEWVKVSYSNSNDDRSDEKNISFNVSDNLYQKIPLSSSSKYDSMREDFVISLRVLLKKISEIYNSCTHILNLITEICDYDDRALAKLIDTDNNHPAFNLWKNYLGFKNEKSEDISYKKLSSLQNNYEQFISNYGSLLDNEDVQFVEKENKIKKNKEGRRHKSEKKSTKKNKSIYEGMV